MINYLSSELYSSLALFSQALLPAIDATIPDIAKAIPDISTPCIAPRPVKQPIAIIAIIDRLH